MKPGGRGRGKHGRLPPCVRRTSCILNSMAPMGAAAGNRAGGPGLRRGRVALVEGFSWNACECHIAESQTHTFRVEGLYLPGLALQEAADAIGAFILQGQHLLLDLENKTKKCTMTSRARIHKHTCLDTSAVVRSSPLSHSVASKDTLQIIFSLQPFV